MKNSYIMTVSGLLSILINTRWTFYRVKLVFECDFEISCSSGPLELWDPLDLGTWELLDFRTFGTLPSSTTSSYFLLPPPITSSSFFYLISFLLLLPPNFFYFLLHPFTYSYLPITWHWKWTLDLYIDVKKLWGGWWVHLDYNVSSSPFFDLGGDGPSLTKMFGALSNFQI